MLVCETCATDAVFFEAAVKGMGAVPVRAVDCMSGCSRAQTVAFRGAGKVAYLFGDITVDDLPDLRNFAALYAAPENGTFADARVLGTLRTKAIARIPACT